MAIFFPLILLAHFKYVFTHIHVRYQSTLNTVSIQLVKIIINGSNVKEGENSFPFSEG